MGWTVDLIEGAPAHALLRDEAFIRQWTELSTADPRSTVYQEPEFCSAWFDASGAREQPVLLVGRDDDSRALVGLMVLSRPTGTNRIRHAGAHQAIYDGWIAKPELQSAFAAAAVERVFEVVRPRRWLFRYLPPGSRVGWAERSGATVAPIVSRISTYQLPIWDLTDAAFLQKKVKHKRLRNYANRYKKEGDLVLERITDPDRAAAAVEQLVTWVDFRQGAVNWSLPFREDETKLDFYQALARSNQSTRVTMLRVDARPLAIQLDTYDRDQICLCLHGYDPSEGQRSPGMILLVRLAEELLAEGVRQIDMTPGENTWKDDYTNRWDEGHRVEFYAVPEEATLDHAKAVVERRAKTVLKKLGTEPRKIKDQLTTIRAVLDALPGGLRRTLVGTAPVVHEVAVSAGPSEPSEPSKLDAQLEAMLTIHRAEPTTTVQRVLFDALKRFERSWYPLTHTGPDGQLDLLAWYALPPVKRVDPPPTAPMPWLAQAELSEPPTDAMVIVVSYERGSGADVQTVFGPAFAEATEAGVERVWVVTGPEHAHARRWAGQAGRKQS